jgi:hypothetical protein
MTTTNPSIPPLRDLPPGRLAERQHHLLAELQREPGTPPRLSRPSVLLPRMRIAVFAGGVAALAGILAIALLATRAGTGTASAAEVQTKIALAMSAPLSISAEYTVRTQPVGPVPRIHRGCLNCQPVVPTPSRFLLSADGSYSIITAPPDAKIRTDSAYDVRSGVETAYIAGGVAGLDVYLTETNLDPSQPARSPEAQLAAWVQHALTSHNPQVKNISFDSRSAWSLTLRFERGDDFFDTYGARVDVIVDQVTGLVLQVTQYAASPDRWTSIETIKNLQLNPPTAASDFTVAKPAGAVRAVTVDFGFVRVPVSKATSIIGYQPLLPSQTGGRDLAEFAVAKSSSQKLLPEMVGTPTYRDVASARYGRGLSSFTISMRRGQPSDVVPGGISARTVTLTDGALKGDTAWLSTSPPDPGYLAVFHNGFVVQIHAFSTRDALMVANSLTQTR